VHKMQNKPSNVDSNAFSVWQDRARINKLRGQSNLSSEEEGSVKSDPESYTKGLGKLEPVMSVGAGSQDFGSLTSSSMADQAYQQFVRDKNSSKFSKRSDQKGGERGFAQRGQGYTTKQAPDVQKGPIKVDAFTFEQRYVDTDGNVATLKRSIWERVAPVEVEVPKEGIDVKFISKLFRETDGAVIQSVFDNAAPVVVDSEVSETVSFIDPFAKGSD